MPTFAAILPAWGQARRFGADKLAADLDGRTVLQRSIACFTDRMDVSHVIVPTRHEVAGMSSKVRVVAGGASRAQTVLLALRQLPEDVEWVAVHDAARPLLSDEVINRVRDAAFQYSAAAPAVAIAGTVKRAASTLPALVGQTLDRSQLWSLQTPQFCRRADLQDALRISRVPLEHITDDLQALELAGLPTWLVPGDERNLKITTPTDLIIARALLQAGKA